MKASSTEQQDPAKDSADTNITGNALPTGGLRELPPWLWFWLPLAAFVFPYLTRPLLSKSAYASYIYGEFGIMENLTVLALAVGVIISIRLFGPKKVFPSRWIGVWCLLIGIGCFYMAGEEISWGQHFLGWQTPEIWSALEPEQDETNLHNLHRIFNDYPRSLLAAAIVFASAVAPLYFRFKGVRLHPASVAYWLWPTGASALAGLLSIAVTFHKRFVQRVLDGSFSRQEAIWVEESQEVFFGLFLMLYLWSIYSRMKALEQTSEPSAMPPQSANAPGR